MATAKQLAALKKGREAMAKKRAAGTVKKRVKKSPVAKTKRAIAPKFLVQVKLHGNKIGYVTSKGALDTEPSMGAKYLLAGANTKANAFFKAHKAALLWVKVVPVPKP